MRNKPATRSGLRAIARLRVLPLRVAWFQWKARRRALTLGDSFTLASSTRPADLALLLRLARGRRRVVELGTANGWTAIALAISDRRRSVITFDPFDRPERRAYLALVSAALQRRIRFIARPGEAGPAAAGLDAAHGAVELLYIDSSHARDATIAEVRAWIAALSPGALIVFDDYEHPDFPGVAEAVAELGLTGRKVGTLFVHEHLSAQITGGAPAQRSATAPRAPR